MTATLFLLLISFFHFDAEQLVPGHWLEIKGGFDDAGVFVASAAELIEPLEGEELVGTVQSVRLAGRRFICLGQEVHVSDKTDWIRMEPDNLNGKRVKIEGHYQGPRKFSARSIAVRGAGRDRVAAPIDQVEAHEDGLHIKLLNSSVFIPAAVELKASKPIGSYARSEPRQPPDDNAQAGVRLRDDDDDIRGAFTLGDQLSVGVRAEWTVEEEDNFNLRAGDPEDRRDNELSLRAEVVWRPSDDFYALLGYRGTVLFRDRQDEAFDAIDRSRLSELYGYASDVLLDGVDLQVGRQDFDEEREWLYDQNLDALRLIIDRPCWHAELSASSTLSNGSPRDEASDNLIAYVTNQDPDRVLGAYLIDRRDDRSGRDYPFHFGLRALGEWLPDQDVWAELSILRGYMGNTDLSSFGYDVGTTWKPDCLGSGYVTAGWAFGSGDDNPTDGRDEAFRQTGLHDNNDKWGGVTSFKYYGELFDPELSNLSILSLGIGTRIGRKNSIDLILHEYMQDEPAPTLRDAGIGRAPDGIHRDLGYELDLVFGSRALDDIDVEVVLSAFEPGDAFPGTSTAYFAKIQFRYRF